MNESDFRAINRQIVEELARLAKREAVVGQPESLDEGVVQGLPETGVKRGIVDGKRVVSYDLGSKGPVPDEFRDKRRLGGRIGEITKNDFGQKGI